MDRRRMGDALTHVENARLRCLKDFTTPRKSLQRRFPRPTQAPQRPGPPCCVLNRHRRFGSYLRAAYIGGTWASHGHQERYEGRMYERWRAHTSKGLIQQPASSRAVPIAWQRPPTCSTKWCTVYMGMAVSTMVQKTARSRRTARWPVLTDGG